MPLKSLMHLLYDYYHGNKLCNSHMKLCNCSNYEALLSLYLLHIASRMYNGEENRLYIAYIDIYNNTFLSLHL